MKMFPLLMVFFATGMISCNNEDCCLPPPPMKLSGRFVHEITDCDIFEDPEKTCIEWVEFLNTTEVDFSYNGFAAIQSFSYVIEDDTLTLQGPPTSSFIGFFTIESPTKLKRIDTGDVWEKKE